MRRNSVLPISQGKPWTQGQERKIELDEAQLMRLIKKRLAISFLSSLCDMGADKIDAGRFLNQYVEFNTVTNDRVMYLPRSLRSSERSKPKSLIVT